MGTFQFKQSQLVNAPVKEVWDFISSPSNLKEITPDHMGFDITSADISQKIYPGLIISYKVKPLLGIKMNWVTEIKNVVDNQFFVDEQRVGPYTMWHHQHHIEAQGDCTMMHDIITYIPPMGFIGRIANTLFIHKNLIDIFEYRKEALKRKFP
ncbi:MAG: ligand-binding SRPBCC domain-containing protein [Bacteroidia bacterium]